MADVILKGGGGLRLHGAEAASALMPAAPKKVVEGRWAAVCPRASGREEQTWPRRLCCAGLATLLAVTPQHLSWVPTLKDWTVLPLQAQAAGLLSMPPQILNNRYFLVRAGASFFESQGVIHTNPVSKTSVDSGLSAEGLRQTVRAATELRDLGACDGVCWIWPSITQRSYQAAEIIARFNRVTYSRIVPEYSFLDARGLGAYENRDLSAIAEVYANDFESSTRRPPRFTDGTPNESVSDVLVRMVQLMSILETQYAGDNVIIVSPDSDNLSILQAALTGQDLRRHSALAFAPGEVRRIDNSDIPAKRPLLSGKFKMGPVRSTN